MAKLAEQQFIVECLKRNLLVSIPVHDHAGYDQLVQGASGKIYKVQIKSTKTTDSHNRSVGAYRFQLVKGSSQKDRYLKRDVDFFALYIVELNLWYIVPHKAQKSSLIRVYPNKDNNPFSKFKLAFHLFK